MMLLFVFNFCSIIKCIACSGISGHGGGYHLMSHSVDTVTEVLQERASILIDQCPQNVRLPPVHLCWWRASFHRMGGNKTN